MTDPNEIFPIDNIDIHPVKNGFLVTVHNEDGESEFIFDSPNKLLRFIKPLVNNSFSKD